MTLDKDVGPVRLDKWLWAARLFRSRALAAEAIGAGHVRVADERTKPARAVRVGDVLSVRIGPFEHRLCVLALSSVRRDATRARLLYKETAASLQERERIASMLRAARAASEPAPSRPVKRDRRALERLRGH